MNEEEPETAEDNGAAVNATAPASLPSSRPSSGRALTPPAAVEGEPMPSDASPSQPPGDHEGNPDVRAAWGEVNSSRAESTASGSPMLPSIKRGSSAFCQPGTIFRNTFNTSVPSTKRTDASVRNLRTEVMSLRNRAAIEIGMRDQEIAGLRQLCSEQRETIDKLRQQMRDKDRALKDLVRIEDVQLRACSRVTTDADVKVKELKNKIYDMKRMHAQALDRAQNSIEFAKKERNALSAALASLASQALGGGAGASEEVNADQEAAAAYAGEFLPMTPSVWLNLKYSANDAGKLMSVSKKAGTEAKPFDGDGARAVETLMRQVSRLWSGRAKEKARNKELTDQLERAQNVLDAINADFEVVNIMLDRVHAEGQNLASLLKIPSLVPEGGLPPTAMSGRISERFAIVEGIVNGLAMELLLSNQAVKYMKDAATSQAKGTPLRTPAPVREEIIQQYKEDLAAAYGDSGYLSRATIVAQLEQAAKKEAQKAKNGAKGKTAGSAQERLSTQLLVGGGRVAGPNKAKASAREEPSTLQQPEPNAAETSTAPLEAEAAEPSSNARPEGEPQPTATPEAQNGGTEAANPPPADPPPTDISSADLLHRE